MKLYYQPRTRAFTALWMLEEIGAPYEIERVDIMAPEQLSAAYRAINPMGKLPGLVDGENRFGETAAVLLYLAEKFPEKGLAPPPGAPNRGRFLQWLLFSATNIEPAATERMNKTTPNERAMGWGSYDRTFAALEEALSGQAYLFGEAFTAADLYLASTLRYMMMFGMVEKRPAFERLVTRATARPSFARATAIENAA